MFQVGTILMLTRKFSLQVKVQQYLPERILLVKLAAPVD